MFLILNRLVIEGFGMGFNIKFVAKIESIISKSAKKVGLGESAATAVNKSASVAQEVPTKANPLILDAKAVLAKNKVITPPSVEFKKITNAEIENKFIKIFNLDPPSEYEKFLNSIGQEMKPIISSIEEEALKTINPIESKNISHIKNELNYMLENCNPVLKDKITNCQDPLELFKLIKKNFLEISTGSNNVKDYLWVDEAALSIEEYSMLQTQVTRNGRKIMRTLTPKSTNPEVLKLEQEVKNLGMKDVNFSDDLVQAKLIKSAITDLIEKNMPLPHSITVTPMLSSDWGGLTQGASCKIKRNGYIYLRSTKEIEADKQLLEASKLYKNSKIYQNAPLEFQEKLTKEYEDSAFNHHSTSNPKHTIYHETAHTFQPLRKTLKLNDEEMATANEISFYAATRINGGEAMPEIFAKLMDGQTLTDKQMELYLKLGGIVPKF